MLNIRITYTIEISVKNLDLAPLDYALDLLEDIQKCLNMDRDQEAVEKIECDYIIDSFDPTKEYWSKEELDREFNKDNRRIQIEIEMKKGERAGLEMEKEYLRILKYLHVDQGWNLVAIKYNKKG